MSHFAVLVIWDNVEKQLSPFDENLEMPRYVEATREQSIERNRKKIEEYRDDTYAKYLADPEKYKSDCTNNAHIKYLEEEFPKKLQWTDEEHYQEAIKYTSKENIWPNGEVYSQYNPRSKWDWYQVWWRYAGRITVKEWVEYTPPEFSWWWDEESKKEVLSQRKTDSALIKDIDLDAMSLEDIKQYTERYELARKFDELEMKDKMRFWWDAEEIEFAKTHSIREYLDAFTPHPISAYAYLHDGNWYSKWEMGWFGMSNDKTTEVEWTKQVKEFFSKLPPETRVTFVDCHI